METNVVPASVRHEVLCRIAELCGFSYRQAICLPSAIGVFAKSAGWSEPRMADEMFYNAPLREYLCEVVRKTAEGPIPGFDGESKEVRQ